MASLKCWTRKASHVSPVDPICASHHEVLRLSAGALADCASRWIHRNGTDGSGSSRCFRSQKCTLEPSCSHDYGQWRRKHGLRNAERETKPNGFSCWCLAGNEGMTLIKPSLVVSFIRGPWVNSLIPRFVPPAFGCDRARLPLKAPGGWRRRGKASRRTTCPGSCTSPQSLGKRHPLGW